MHSKNIVGVTRGLHSKNFNGFECGLHSISSGVGNALVLEKLDVFAMGIGALEDAQKNIYSSTSHLTCTGVAFRLPAEMAAGRR